MYLMNVGHFKNQRRRRVQQNLTSSLRPAGGMQHSSGLLTSSAVREGRASGLRQTDPSTAVSVSSPERLLFHRRLRLCVYKLASVRAAEQ